VEEDRVQPSIIGLTREEIRRYPGGFEDVVRTVSTLPGVAVNNAAGRNDLLVRAAGLRKPVYHQRHRSAQHQSLRRPGHSSGSLSYVNSGFCSGHHIPTAASAPVWRQDSSVLTLTMTDAHNKTWEPKLTISPLSTGWI